jgi:hypothetical protein
MYETEARAREVAQALVRAELAEESVLVIAPGPNAEARLAEANDAGRIPKGNLGPLARGLAKGRTVVSASGPLNWGSAIEATLERFDPVGTEELSPYGSGAGTPLSEVLGIPVLTRDSKPIFGALTRSDFFLGGFFPLLTNGGRPFFGGLTSSKFAPTSFFPLLTNGGKPFFGGLASSDFAFSKMLGMPLLSKNGTPLSSFLGLKTLSERDDKRD